METVLLLPESRYRVSLHNGNPISNKLTTRSQTTLIVLYDTRELLTGGTIRRLFVDRARAPNGFNRESNILVAVGLLGVYAIR
jgi:hypothetical protein